MIVSERGARAFVADRCDADGLARLEQLIAALAEENRRQNLVSRSSLEFVWQRHLADSAQLLDLAGDDDGTWLDLGTGAGFPGLVIAAMQPGRPVTLVESRRKRSEWLMRMANELALPKCHVACAPAEQIAAFPAGVVSARAFAPLPRLIAIARRFSTSGTRWLLPKGRSAAQEVAELPGDLRVLFHVEPSQTDGDAGIVVGQGVMPEDERR